MNKTQRIVVIAYCILLVYCCLWIPWRYDVGNRGYVRLGYAWLWVGPTRTQPPPDTLPADFLDRAAGATPTMPIPRARPDMPLITLRLIAASAIGGAAFLLAGIKWKNPAKRN